MPAWRWSGPCARAIPARPRWCCSATCSPARGATGTRSVRTGPRRRTPRSARWQSIAARESSDDLGIRAPTKPSRDSPKPIPAIRPRRLRCTSSGTCSLTAVIGRARRSGSASWSRVTPQTCALRSPASGSPHRRCAGNCSTARPRCTRRRWRRRRRNEPRPASGWAGSRSRGATPPRRRRPGPRARREVALPPLRLAAPPLPAPPPAVATSLARLDTLVLAGLDTAAEAEVRTVLGRAPQQDVDALLAWSDGLAVRGFGPAAVRLGWQAALKAPADPRVLRAIFPWPNRPAVQAEAAEFGVDPFLFVAIVRHESVFDAEALSPAGARGLAQLTPGTAALTARE